MEKKTIVVDVNKLNELMEFTLSKNIPELIKLPIMLLIDGILLGKYSPDSEETVKEKKLSEEEALEIIYHYLSQRI